MVGSLDVSVRSDLTEVTRALIARITEVMEMRKLLLSTIVAVVGVLGGGAAVVFADTWPMCC